MEDLRVVVKLGSDYVKAITPNGICVTNSNDEKLVFCSKEVADAFVSPIKFFNSYDEIKIISLVDDVKESYFVGVPLTNLLEKAKPLTLEKAKQMFEKHSVISLSKRYNVNGETVYTSLVCSQRNLYNSYSIEIIVDKDKKLVSSVCSCPDREEHKNALCKHTLATIMAILDI